MDKARPRHARRELSEAMMAVPRTGQGPRAQVASMGSSIKWADQHKAHMLTPGA